MIKFNKIRFEEKITTRYIAPMERFRVKRKIGTGGSVDNQPVPSNPFVEVRGELADPPKPEKDRRGGARYGDPNGKRAAASRKATGKGRKPGIPNRSSARLRDQAAKTGELPHEFMLRVMRMEPGTKIGNHYVDWDDVKWAAKGAAPYYGTRLAAIQIKGDRPQTVISLDPEKLKDLTPEQLSTMLAAIAGLTGQPRLLNGNGALGNGKDIEDIDPALYEATLQ